MKTTIFILLFAGTLASAQTVKPVKNYVTPAMVREWVSYLASDEMKGRRNGSPEMETAANWIAGKFRENGLKALPGQEMINNYSFASRQGSVNERNVIAMIEGSDPALKNEYIILSAHFDHIGISHGAGQDSINNGADDNATGTSTLIGIARYIKESGSKPGRSIILAAFSGEENGIRGSKAFVSKSPVPLKNVYYNMNFEMTGHSELLGKNKYYMTGCQKSNLDDVIKAYEKNSGFTLVDTIEITEMLFTMSDNIAFSRLDSKDGITTGIPSGTFATSTMAPYLHTPQDEVEFIDFGNMASLVNHFSRIVLWMSQNKAEIKWTSPGYIRP
jgi:hypothetical protein